MSADSQDVPDSDFSAAALAEWTAHLESMLRGLAHALNNRASALSAVVELSRDPDDDPEMTRSILGSELDRMIDLSKVVRSIGAPRSGGTEAIAPRDVVPEVLAALALHAEQRERVITIDASDAPPIRVARWMIVRALIAMAARAPASDQAGRTVRLTLGEEEDRFVARAGSHQGQSLSTYAGELARAMGGQPLPDGSGFSVPTLTAIRRREGR